jgi:hypothetical protein
MEEVLVSRDVTDVENTAVRNGGRRLRQDFGEEFLRGLREKGPNEDPLPVHDSLDIKEGAVFCGGSDELARPLKRLKANGPCVSSKPVREQQYDFLKDVREQALMYAHEAQIGE